MLVNLYLPQGTSLYDKLKDNNKLAALELTLRHFNVPQSGKKNVAEALLRLELMAIKKMPRAGDKRAKILFRMFSYFQRHHAKMEHQVNQEC